MRSGCGLEFATAVARSRVLQVLEVVAKHGDKRIEKLEDMIRHEIMKITPLMCML